jgi:hypothetical protein
LTERLPDLLVTRLRTGLMQQAFEVSMLPLHEALRGQVRRDGRYGQPHAEERRCPRDDSETRGARRVLTHLEG